MDDEKQHLRQRWQNNPKNDPTSQNNQSNSQPNNAQNFTESLNQNIDGPPVNSGPQANVQCYNSATEYSQAVHQWLVQYHMWHQMSWFYMTFPMHMMQMSLMQRHQALYSGEASGVPTQTPPRSHSQSASNAAQPAAATPTQAQQPGQTQAGVEFKIPPLWKRVASEFIDFFLLFVVKLAVTILFVEYFGLVDLRHYDLEYLMTTDMDYNTAFAMTSELVAMEIVNRVFICIFETMCLRRGLAGAVGGTTPGKRMMGLKVISCREVVNLPGNKIIVIPAGNIGTWNALVRSVIKNFSLAFFFPVCLTVFFFQHNRAAYDIISNSIVIESRDRPRMLWR